jgi:hypothetical protein
VRVVAAEKLPVDLVERFGLQNRAAHDAAALGGAHDDFEAPEEHVEARLHHGRVAGAFNGKGCAALLVPVDFALVLLLPYFVVGGDARLEEVEGGVAAQRFHRGTARRVERVAVGVRLRQRGGEQRSERRDGGKSKGLHGVWLPSVGVVSRIYVGSKRSV